MAAPARIKIRRVDLYADEFLAGTAMLDEIELGIYTRAIMLIYSAGGPVPVDHLRRLSKCHGNTFRRCLEKLKELNKLEGNDGEIDQKRCGFELEKARIRVGNASENGAKGNQIKWMSIADPTEPTTNNYQPLESPLTPHGGESDKIAQPKANPRAGGSNPRALGSNPRARTKFNQNGVSEHRATYGPLRDPVEIAKDLGLRK
jgi:uncharacterized protein YdaU (DUF1376 family)